MKTFRIFVSACFFVAAHTALAQQPAPPTPAAPDTSASAGSGGLPKSLREIDDRALPFLSKWTVCEPQVQKIIQQYFKTVGKDPGPDLAKISLVGEPKRNGKYELYMVKCGSATAVRKELEDTMLQSVRDLLAEPVGQEGEEKYCHDFTFTSSVGGKTSNEIQQKVGIGENNYRMPTGGRQYFSLSLFEQYLRVGATNWWLQNVFGNDPASYLWTQAGEGKIMARRPLIDNYDNATRRVIPNILKFHLGYAYRLSDNVDTRRNLAQILEPRRLNVASEGRLLAGMEAFIPLGDDMKTSVFGVNVNLELPLSAVNELGAIDQSTYTKIPITDRNRRVVVNSHPAGEVQLLDDTKTTPLVRTSGQVSFFYTWWLEVEGSENPPDNIFRADIGINYLEVKETAIVRSTSTGLHYLAANDTRGLLTYRPDNLLDWVYAKFEYRNETTFPFGASLQYSNQAIMADFYFPLLGNWLYLEAKVAQLLRPTRDYEPSTGRYFMISPVFRILIPR
jgi:hypothetical protein